MKHVITVLLRTLSAHGLATAEPLEIGSQQPLFLDDFIIERINAPKRVMRQLAKHGAVTSPDQLWEISLQTRCSPTPDGSAGYGDLFGKSHTTDLSHNLDGLFPDRKTQPRIVSGRSHHR